MLTVLSIGKRQKSSASSLAEKACDVDTAKMENNLKELEARQTDAVLGDHLRHAANNVHAVNMKGGGHWGSRNNRPAVTDALLKVPAALATSIR